MRKQNKPKFDVFHNTAIALNLILSLNIYKIVTQTP